MTTWRKQIVIVFVIGLFVIVGGACASSAEDSVMGGFSSAAEAPAADADFFGEERGAFDTSESAMQNSVELVERVIIRSGDLTVVVTDPESSMAELAALTESLGGWVVNSNVMLTGSERQTKRATITVRIPAERFDEVIATVKEGVIEVRSESTEGVDVTEEYVDVSARLDNLRATEARVLTFLDEARNVEEALEVNRELSNLQAQIESLQGRLNFLRQSADFSPVTVTYVADVDAAPIEIGSWRPSGTAKDAVEFLVDGLQFLGDVLIWLVIVGIPAFIIFYAVRWTLRRLGVRNPLRRGWRNAAASEQTQGDAS